jgi:hypothetical protein
MIGTIADLPVWEAPGPDPARQTVRVTADELRGERKLRAGLRPADVPDGANESDPLEACQRLRSSW